MPVPPELSRDRAWACVLQNLATPGIGSLKAQRMFAGVCQLSLAIVSGFFICAWVISWCYRIYEAQNDETLPPDSSGWLLKWAIGFFLASWLWAMATCVNLLLQTKASGRSNMEKVPPRLNLPDKPPKLL
jgi:hypothetical protein